MNKVEVKGRNTSSVRTNVVLASLERTVSRLTGQDAKTLREQPLEVSRKIMEKKLGPMKVISKFPFIGRGNILRDKVISRQDIDALLDEALR